MSIINDAGMKYNFAALLLCIEAAHGAGTETGTNFEPRTRIPTLLGEVYTVLQHRDYTSLRTSSEFKFLYSPVN
jgi:hypothetical protein